MLGKSLVTLDIKIPGRNHRKYRIALGAIYNYQKINGWTAPGADKKPQVWNKVLEFIPSCETYESLSYHDAANSFYESCKPPDKIILDQLAIVNQSEQITPGRVYNITPSFLTVKIKPKHFYVLVEELYRTVIKPDDISHINGTVYEMTEEG